MVNDAMLFGCVLHLVGEGVAFGGEFAIVKKRLMHLGQPAQRHDGEQVARDIEWIQARVVRRTEHRVDQADRPGRVAVTMQELGFGRIRRAALEVIRARAILALLLAKRLHDLPRGRAPVVIERLAIAGSLPVTMGKTHRIAQRIDFPFPLGDAGMHVGDVVLCPLQLRLAARIGQEGVGIRIDRDTAGLPSDQSAEQATQGFVLRGELDVGPDLGRRIAQPHRVDVAGDRRRYRRAHPACPPPPWCPACSGSSSRTARPARDRGSSPSSPRLPVRRRRLANLRFAGGGRRLVNAASGAAMLRPPNIAAPGASASHFRRSRRVAFMGPSLWRRTGSAPGARDAGFRYRWRRRS